MITRNSFAMLGRNVDLILKIMVYIFVLLIVLFAILTAIFAPICRANNWDSNILTATAESLEDVINSGDSELYVAFIDDTSVLLQDTLTSEPLIFMYLVLFVFVAKFLFNLVFIPVGKVVFGRMSCNYGGKFKDVFLLTISKSVLFSLILSLIAVPLDLGVLTACYFLNKVLSPAIGFYSLFIVLFIIIMILSARVSIFGQWIPKMIVENISVTRSFRKQFNDSAKCFSKIYPMIFLSISLFVCLFTSVYLFTIGIISVILIPILTILYTTHNFTAYFVRNKMKFYVDETTIVNRIEIEDEN